MTAFGGSTPLAQTRVEAKNWISALSAARQEIGESGGIPPGASCSVAPDGRVTIHDAAVRKTYLLAPEAEQSLTDPKRPAGPKVPAESVPRPSSSPPSPRSSPPPPTDLKIPRPSDAPPSKSKKIAQTMAFDSRELGLTPPSAAPQPPPAAQTAPAALPEPKSSKRKRKAAPQTLAYDAKELGIDKLAAEAAAGAAAPKANHKQTIAFEAGQLPVGPPPQEAKPQVSKQTIAYDAKQLPIQAPPQEAKPQVSKQTIAYDAKQLPVQAPPQEAKPQVSKQTIAYDAKQLGVERPASEVKVQAVAAASEPVFEGRATIPDAIPVPPACELLHSRDEEPTKDLPLCYRERTYFVPEGTSDAVTEALLMARFEELKDELSSRPKGKLVNMAVFDHRWTERPERPPRLMLQWKDWRGDPVVQRPRTSQPALPAQPSSVPPGTSGSPQPRTASQQRLAAQPSAAPSTPSQQGLPAQPSAPPPKTPSQQSLPAQPSAPPPKTPSQQSLPAQPSAPPSPPPQPSAPPAEAAPQPSAPIAPVPPAAPPPVVAVVPTPQPPPPAASDIDLAISEDVVETRQRITSGDDRLASAFEALQDLAFLATPLEGLEFVVRLLEELVPSEAISACLYDINTDDFRFVALSGTGSQERRGEAVPRVSGLLGSAARHLGEPLLVEDVTGDARYDPGVDGRVGLDPTSMCVVAVAHQGRLLGSLSLLNRVDQAQYSRADANLLGYVATKLGDFLHGVRTRADKR